MIRTVQNEKGVALVVALVMLVLLTMLGTYALSTSSTELFIAGNYRNMQYAFYAAEAGIEAGKNMVKIGRLVKIDKGNFLKSSEACYPKPATVGKTCAEEKLFQPVVGMGGPIQTASYHVDYVKTKSGSPVGSDDDNSVTDYYVITGLGEGPNHAKVTLESMVIDIRTIN